MTTTLTRPRRRLPDGGAVARFLQALADAEDAWLGLAASPGALDLPPDLAADLRGAGWAVGQFRQLIACQVPPADWPRQDQDRLADR